MGEKGRTPKLADEDYIGMVEATCRLTGTPMAPTPVIFDQYDLPVTKQTLKNNLERLSKEGLVQYITVGSGYAWSVSGDQETGGKVDVSNFNWEYVDIESIPEEILFRHPKFEPNLHKHVTKANNVIEYSLYSILAGLVILLLNEIRPIQSSFVLEAGAVAMVAGFVFILIGLCVTAVFTFVSRLSKSDVYEAATSTVFDLIPIEVSMDQGALTVEWGEKK